MPKKYVCKHCHGVLKSTRCISLEVCITHHDESCPGQLPKVKKSKPEPRRRVIPRQRL